MAKHLIRRRRGVLVGSQADLHRGTRPLCGGIRGCHTQRRQGPPGRRHMVRGIFLRHGGRHDGVYAHQFRFLLPHPPVVAVGVSPYSVLHNEAYFPDPFDFHPERWPDTEDNDNGSFSQEAKATMRRAFVPFAQDFVVLRFRDGPHGGGQGRRRDARECGL
ncbi:hypothetical protein F4818DRAFT_430882 [Hypoxylon cercidicola]|nr:hypothetical protein F4818DRAFT_430882 [Hypoxylon cercidicola]